MDILGIIRLVWGVCVYLAMLSQPLIANNGILPQVELLINEQSWTDAAEVGQQAGQLFLKRKSKYTVLSSFWALRALYPDSTVTSICRWTNFAHLRSKGAHSACLHLTWDVQLKVKREALAVGRRVHIRTRRQEVCRTPHTWHSLKSIFNNWL